MSVTLDNIQFYDGPPKPHKPPHPAFSSRGYCTGVFPSSQRHISSQTTGCSLMSRSTASHANNQKHEQTAVVSNEFDMELGKSLEKDLPLLANDNALEDASYDLLPTFELLHQEDFDRDLSLDPPSTTTGNRVCELGDTCPSDTLSPVRPSASNPPLFETNPVIRPDSANLIGDTNQSAEVEVAQQREKTLPPSYPSTIDDCVLSTSVCEHSTETSPPFRSISPAAKNSKEDSFLSLASEDHNKEKHDTHHYAGQEAMCDSDSCSVTTTLLINPEQVTLERADTAEAMDLELLARSKLLSIPDEFTTTGSKKRGRRKRRNESEKTSKRPCQKGKYPSVAVVIPPLRSRTTRSARSNPQAVSSDVSLNGDSDRSDNSSDEDYTRHNPQSRFFDKESIEALDCKHTRIGTAASYESQGSRDGLLDCYNTSRDIIGRAILTIESEGSKPTFFLTLVPDENPSPTHPSTNCTHKAMAPSGKRKQSVTKSRRSQAKRERRPYLPNEDYLLVKLKERERLAWDKIAAYFPGRSPSSLQVHYSTKLKHRSTGQPRLRTEKRKRK